MGEGFIFYRGRVADFDGEGKGKRRRTEVRGQERPEARGQRSEDRGQGAGGRGQRTEDRGQGAVEAGKQETQEHRKEEGRGEGGVSGHQPRTTNHLSGAGTDGNEEGKEEDVGGKISKSGEYRGEE